MPDAHNAISEDVSFASIRSDWYNANSLMERLAVSCILGRTHRRFVGFPRQWLPVFAWLDIRWSGSVSPLRYLPLFSDLPEEQIAEIIEASIKGQALRSLVEFASVCDGVIADFLDRMDKRGFPAIERRPEIDSVAGGDGKDEPRLLLTTWQSYGHPSVRKIDLAALAVRSSCERAIVLPCSRKRPYHESRTHKKIYEKLGTLGIAVSGYHRVVLSAAGFLPQEIWNLPEVTRYDAGVPDVYRLICLGREYFSRQKYKVVLDCQVDERYSDVLSILSREGSISKLERLRVSRQLRRRGLYFERQETRYE